MTYIGLETAWTLSKGERHAQEDVLHLWFEQNTRSGYIIIADGMGGHTSGDIASSLAVEAVDEAITELWAQKDYLESNLQAQLPKLIEAANQRLKSYIKINPETSGMGTTLLVALILEGNLYWASIGDSPLYILRNNKMVQLNEDHSMARQIDQMVHAGQLSQQAAKEHPNRSALTSVVMGAPITDMDCHVVPFELRQDDILIAATDGIRTLSVQVLTDCTQPSNKSAEDITASITEAIDADNNPNQDNLALCVARVL